MDSWRGAAAIGLMLFGSAASTLAEAEGGWRKLYEERGITISTREQPGQELPSFRGQGRIRGDVLHVLAVVLDDSRTPEWAESADEASVLRVIDGRTQLVYSRSHQRWPVRDRDLVMKRTVEVLAPGQAFRVRLVCVEGEKPELTDVIRISDCETIFVLHRIDAATTSVDYQVRADPRGNNPSWLVRWASKTIPLETLTALESQVARTGGLYEEAVQFWRAAR